MTYKQIENELGVKSCWIAHVKELLGLIEVNENRRYPCPPVHRAAIARLILSVQTPG